MCEAMAAGLPVIATRVGGIPEFVRDGIDGYLVKPNDPEAIRASLMKFIKEPKLVEQMGRNAREQICLKCDEGIVIEKELRVLESVL